MNQRPKIPGTQNQQSQRECRNEKNAFKHWRENPRTPNGKAHKSQLNNVQQHLPDKLGIEPKDFNRHFVKISWVKNSFDYSAKRKWSSYDLLTQGFERNRRQRGKGAEQ